MKFILYFIRTVDEVKCLINHAKLTEEELVPLTQTLEFSIDFGEANEDVKLLELDKNLLESMKKGDR